jgi:hypothetical protein
MNTIQEINELLSIETAKEILSSLGVEFKRKQMKLRDERTPSASFYIKNNKVRIQDFGSGFDGDIFDTLKEHFSMNFKVAIEYISPFLGLNGNRANIIPKPKKTYKEEYLSSDEILRIWNSYKKLDEVSEDKAIELVNKLLPFEYYQRARKENKKAFLNAVRYDPRQDEVVVATFTPAGEILTIRHRRYKIKDTIIKWKSLKNTKANYYSQIRITDPQDPIFIIEGTHDYVTALLLDINFIALPSKHYKTFKEEELSIFKGKKFDFVIIPDLDENTIKELEVIYQPIFKGLEPFAKSFSLWDLRKIFYYLKGIEKVKDLSDLAAVSDMYDSIYLTTFHLIFEFINTKYKEINNEC